jgi:hypothetical protein
MTSAPQLARINPPELGTPHGSLRLVTGSALRVNTPLNPTCRQSCRSNHSG